MGWDGKGLVGSGSGRGREHEGVDRADCAAPVASGSAALVWSLDIHFGELVMRIDKLAGWPAGSGCDAMRCDVMNKGRWWWWWWLWRRRRWSRVRPRADPGSRDQGDWQQLGHT